MPLGCLFKREKSNSMSDKEKRAKLGLKVVMAQQNPEPVYDLSDCAMVELPPDTFVMCKLLQKTSLILNNNLMTTFEKGGKLHELEAIEYLDLSNNKLSHLPDDIHKLKKLKVLKLGTNKLKHLPSSMADLSRLQELDLSTNKFSKVPTSVCALPRLKVLTLTGNSISVLPKEFCELQKSLCTLELDTDKLQTPPPETVNEGVEAVMRFLCEKSGIEYQGLSEELDDSTSESTSPPVSAGLEPAENQEMLDYFRKKAELVKAQLAAEEAFQVQEQKQLAQILKDTNTNKQQLLEELSQSPAELQDYERKKLALLQDQCNIEEKMRSEQAEQLEKYLASSNDKEALISNLSAQQADIDQEVEGLVSAKERERHRLLKDLTSSEQETAAAVQELLTATASRRNEDFLILLQQQEQEMQSLLSGIAEAAAELRRSEVVAAMKAALVEEAVAEQRRLAVQKEQGNRICSLLEENDLVNDHIEGVISTRMADQEVWVSTLLEDEECQAAAFKLLLLKSDLKRNNILRQIGQVEYELARLSSLEVRKKKFGVKYGSNTMLDQRATLAGLLKSLLSEKKERENQLIEWFGRVGDMRSSDTNEDDFWLVQYQRLLAMKPAGLAEAEEQLEPKVRAVLQGAHAADLIPVFARHKITYADLLNMTEEDAAAMGIGPATYHSLQRALQIHLAASKLGPQKPSAPSEEDMPYEPSAPEVESDEDAPSAPALEDLGEGASAPPLEDQYVEAECVICLDSGCEVVFLPCGHVCACSKCCTTIAVCPMCRSPVISKILLTY
ncbi:E3 ubiquitin-protein ligase LRSAM1-like [Penaeus chinensis]|uniref:E3 ubiquitin-protein ligase LRSAM1-like n=1 Tax=Penaeus chinensis TaxID=139456 RepID=UPI001FB70E59|nr:E3 ubiquitin-protein ligase LRSAM1-like [Penaeus chinensis]XP_047475349.1 E3 ubiquitin-protein ligase LRSAM1-like [Penaeus chinensis]XP_047475350.1 E3 ubiquitin-protein ligase LRSAM1-like [Penaeus chinensis]XP_047475351.1 E3 ubiquitin-protein ligase LRSAM1-like [Penaeus chinensis]XP_047475352.1 E3 ubiquitin-protein ligase LRSAM1-like [Penaeus chinensis]